MKYLVWFKFLPSISMFHLRSVWEHNINEPIDQQSIVLANILRTKDNSAQAIIGTLLGKLYVIKFS